jgi:uncharacterized protein (DUF488 family)
MQLFTIGHSNHTIEAFISLLQQHGVTALADVRSHPYSRYLSHFSQAELKPTLLNAGIQYVFLGRELGARPKDTSCYVDGKAVYEKIASTPEFIQGIQRLVKGTASYKISLMCAEQDPITCHRAILVCQHLQGFNLDINHILKQGNLETHNHLEERLLGLHSLEKKEVPAQVQLSLFDNIFLPEEAELNYSREDSLKLAYQRQADRIAYIEKSDVKNE